MSVVIVGLLILIPVACALIYAFYALNSKKQKTETINVFNEGKAEVQSLYDRIDRMAS